MGELLDLVGLLRLTAARRGEAPPRRPTPRAALASADDVEAHRSLSCGDYDRCLDEVLVAGWPGWTCARCARFAGGRARRAARLDVEATARPGAEYPVD